MCCQILLRDAIWKLWEKGVICRNHNGRHCLFDFMNFWSNYCKYGNYSVCVVGRRLQSTFLVRVRVNPQRVLLIKIRIKKSLLCRSGIGTLTHYFWENYCDHGEQRLLKALYHRLPLSVQVLSLACGHGQLRLIWGLVNAVFQIST